MTHHDESAPAPDHPAVRRASLALSTLLLTAEESLESYRRGRCADPELDLADLRRARQILCAVGFAIGARDPERWRRIELCWRALRNDAARVPEEPKKLSSEAVPLRDQAARHPSAAIASQAAVAPSAAVASGAAVASNAVVASNAAVASIAPVASNAGFGPPPPRAAPHAAKGAVDETAALDSSVLAAGEPPLPFHGHGPAPPPAAAQLRPRPQDDIHQTAVVTHLPAEAAPLPFDRRKSSSPDLSVAQYAALSAECEAMPERVAEIRARYGLVDERAHRSLELDWQTRLSADAELRREFEAHRTKIELWIRQRRG